MLLCTAYPSHSHPQVEYDQLYSDALIQAAPVSVVLKLQLLSTCLASRLLSIMHALLRHHETDICPKDAIVVVIKISPLTDALYHPMMCWVHRIHLYAAHSKNTTNVLE